MQPGIAEYLPLTLTAYRELSVGAAPVTLDPADIGPADFLFCRVEDGPVRRMFNADPTPTLGMPLYDGDTFWLGDKEMEAIRFVRQGTTNGLLRLEYFRRP